MNEIFRGDDTNSFNQNWLTIRAEFPSDWVVTAAEFKVGSLPSMYFDEPEFPIVVNLTSNQTILLKDENSCYLALYDENGLKRTCEGVFTFKTKKRVV